MDHQVKLIETINSDAPKFDRLIGSSPKSFVVIDMYPYLPSVHVVALWQLVTSGKVTRDNNNNNNNKQWNGET